jgi:hypothetical protein
VHTDDPAALLYWPVAQGVQLDSPAALNWPAGHAPVHVDVVSPTVLPKKPAGHEVHDTVADADVKRPTAHSGQAPELPAHTRKAMSNIEAHGHLAARHTRAPAALYRPTPHAKLHVATVRPVVVPEYPALHCLHDDDPVPF